MITPEYCLVMARYNRWMNERLYAVVAQIPDDERKRDRGAFFRSMHGTLTYASKVDGRTREIARAVATVHLFNHGTHHRGQLTTLMMQAGYDPGPTDVPWLPGVLRLVEPT